MSHAIPQSQEELETHLTEQLQFLVVSADAYDAGFTGEVKRLSVALRILLHDTNRSKCLLTQLNRKKCLFYDSSTQENLEDPLLLSNCVLVLKYLSSDGVSFVPILDESTGDPLRQIDFETWWNARVIKDKDGRTLTRRDLVLSMADQDGGAHVDPALNEKYGNLSRKNSLGILTTKNGSWVPLPQVERAAVRQIAHEVLKTLQPGYTKMLSLSGNGYLIGGIIVKPGNPSNAPVIQSSSNVREVGRNDPCPCNSGLKYKRCHGK